MSKKGPSVEGVTREVLIEMYVNDQNATIESVANHYGVSRETVARWMRRLDIPIKPKSRSGKARDPKARPLEDREWLRSQLEGGKMMIVIARELGVKDSVVSYWARKHGLSNDDKSFVIKEALKKRYPNGRRGSEASNWKGGRQILKTGYVMVYAPDHPSASKDGRVFEHRLVAEQILGRPLTSDEIVHHIDGDKSNNAPDNLIVKTNGQHISEHFLASHEVTALRQRVSELEHALAKYEETCGELED